MSDCGDRCVFPVANLSNESMQTCEQKCSYYGNYFKPSENNTIVHESPYTMAKMMYYGKSDVVFNGITYSNTSDNNNIEVFITKPLHSFGADGTQGVGELIIQHQKNNTGVAPLWVCIPINDITIQAGSAGTRGLSTSILETMIDNIPGVPFIAKGVKKTDSTGYNKNKILVRRADNSSQGYSETTFKTSSSVHHTHRDGDNSVASHRHFHVPGIHADDNTAQSFIDAYTSGATEISNQANLGKSYKLNDVIPLSPYYYYKGVFNSTGDVTYSTCGNIDNIEINVVVFDISNGIPVSSVYATKLRSAYKPGSGTTSYPLLMDNNYQSIPDDYNNVSYHPQPFTNAQEDDIYIDCSNFESNSTKKTVLQDSKNNKVLDAGASITSVLSGFINSSLFSIIIGIIVMYILFKFCRFLLRLIFGKASIPNPGNMMNNVMDGDITGKVKVQ